MWSFAASYFIYSKLHLILLLTYVLYLKKRKQTQNQIKLLEQILCATELFGIKAILLSLGIFFYFNQININIYIDFL